MNISDPIADMLTRIRNAARARHTEVLVPASRTKRAIARILKDEGFIDDCHEERRTDRRSVLRIQLKYVRQGARRHGPQAHQQARPARLRAQDRDPAGAGRPRHRHRQHQPGDHDRRPGPQGPARRRESWRTSGRADDVTYRTLPIPVPRASTSPSTAAHAGQGPQGRRSTRDLAAEHRRSSARTATLRVERPGDDKRSRELHGLTRTLVANMVVGVTTGYRKGLEITGVGYRAQLVGEKLQLNLGYSHPIEIDPPDGHQLRGREPHPPRGHGHRQGAGRPRRRPRPRHPQARALQGQGRPLRRRGQSAARPARPARSAARSKERRTTMTQSPSGVDR